MQMLPTPIGRPRLPTGHVHRSKCVPIRTIPASPRPVKNPFGSIEKIMADQEAVTFLLTSRPAAIFAPLVVSHSRATCRDLRSTRARPKRSSSRHRSVGAAIEQRLAAAVAVILHAVAVATVRRVRDRAELAELRPSLLQNQLPNSKVNR